jgi:hypothetical protein
MHHQNQKDEFLKIGCAALIGEFRRRHLAINAVLVSYFFCSVAHTPKGFNFFMRPVSSFPLLIELDRCGQTYRCYAPGRDHKVQLAFHVMDSAGRFPSVQRLPGIQEVFLPDHPGSILLRTGKSEGFLKRA